MQTECPHCHTVFRLEAEKAEQLTQVRCGHCLAVFTPEILPVDIETENAINKTQSGATETNDNISNNNIEIETENHSDEIDISLIREKYTEKNQTALPDVIPPELRIATRKPIKQRGPFVTFIWSLVIWALVITAVTQYAWYNRYDLLKHPDMRPLFEIACQHLNCTLPEPRDPSRIELSRKNIFTHPNFPHALMVSGTIVNQAEFEQDYPVMELRFENTRGEVIAARRFTPAEYLDLPQNQIRKMEPGNPMAFTLEVIDPGTDVMSYEFTFL